MYIKFNGETLCAVTQIRRRCSDRDISAAYWDRALQYKASAYGDLTLLWDGFSILIPSILDEVCCYNL